MNELVPHDVNLKIQKLYLECVSIGRYAYTSDYLIVTYDEKSHIVIILAQVYMLAYLVYPPNLNSFE